MTSPRHDPSHEKKIISFAVHLTTPYYPLLLLVFIFQLHRLPLFFTIVSGISSALHFRRKSGFASPQTRSTSGMASAALLLTLISPMSVECASKHVGSVLFLLHFAYIRRFTSADSALALQHMNLDLPTGIFFPLKTSMFLFYNIRIVVEVAT